MQQKKIIIFTACLFFLSSLYLFYSSEKATNPNQKDFWAIYFSEPKSLDLNFVIENHSNNTNFHYETLDGKNKVSEGDAIIQNGDKRIIDLNSEVGKILDKKITIVVSTSGDKKEIYKNFEE
jgi:hypothetical protein